MSIFSKNKDKKPSYIQPDKKSDSILVSTDDCSKADNQLKGIKTPGWVYYKEYNKSGGGLKRVVETLAAFSGKGTIGVSTSQITYDSIVICGASLEDQPLSHNLVTPHSVATARMLSNGVNLPVYGYGFSSERGVMAAQRYSEARAAHPNALIFMHQFGNNVSDTRPYNTMTPTEIATFTDGLSALLAVASGDKRFYHSSISFRTYGSPVSDAAIFQDPSLGSKPYNENIIIPWITSNFPHAIGSNGRPKVDTYRWTLNNFENLLLTDGIHMTTSGQTLYVNWLIDTIATIIKGQTPTAITERIYTTTPVAPTNTLLPTITGSAQVGQTLTATTGSWNGTAPINYTYQWNRNGSAISGATNSTYTLISADLSNAISVTVSATNSVNTTTATSTATSNVIAAGGSSGPLIIVNFGRTATSATNNVLHASGASSSNVNNGTSISLVDVDNNSTGIILKSTITGVTTYNGTTDPTAGSMLTGISSGTTGWNKTLLCDDITMQGAYVTDSPIWTIEFSGLVAGASYAIGAVGTRTAANDRFTSVSDGTNTMSWNTSLTPTTVNYINSVSDANGKITLTIDSISGLFAYISGMSIQKI